MPMSWQKKWDQDRFHAEYATKAFLASHTGKCMAWSRIIKVIGSCGYDEKVIHGALLVMLRRGELVKSEIHCSDGPQYVYSFSPSRIQSQT